MKKFKVSFKNKKNKPRYFFAYSYSEKNEKYWFHQKEDQSDFIQFQDTNKVESIEDVTPPSTPFYMG